MTSHSRAARALLVLSIAASGLGAQSERRSLSGGNITIYDLVGAVTIEQGSGSDVTVEVTRRGADAKRLQVDVVKEGDGQSLRVIFPDDDIVYPDLGRWSTSEFNTRRDGTWDRSGNWFRNRVRIKGSGRGTEAWADLRVSIPAGKHVDVFVGVGDVRSTSVNADLGIEVASARVSVLGHTGSLRLSTGSGGAEVRDVKGESLRVDCGSGRVTITGVNVKRADVETGSGGIGVDQVTAPDLRLHTGSGGIRVERATSDRLRLSTGSGSMNLELTNSPTSMDVHSGSGYVSLSLPRDLDAELDIRTGSGGIDSDFAVQVNRVERHRLHGTVGKGTGQIRVETGSGGVRLRRG